MDSLKFFVSLFFVAVSSLGSHHSQTKPARLDVGLIISLLFLLSDPSLLIKAQAEAK